MKKNYLTITLYLLFPMIFNILFFLLGGLPSKLSVWVSYLFIHFAYLLWITSSYLTPKTQSKSLFGSTLSLVSSIHFFITFIIGMIFILNVPESYKTNGTIHLIITGVYLVLFVLIMISNENTAAQEETLEQGLKYIKDGSRILQELKLLTSDIKVQNQIQSIYDILHSSPIKTTEEARVSEEIVLELIANLKKKIKTQSLEETTQNLNKIMEHVNERNRILKYNT
jgi:hypothetical protein